MPTVNIPEFEKVEVAPPRLDVGKGYEGNIIELPTIKETDPADPSMKKSFIEVKIKVLGGPDQQDPDPGTGSKSPAGRTITDRFYLVPGAYFKIKQLMVSAQLLGRKDADSPLAKGAIPLEIFVGVRFPFNIIASMKDGNEYGNVQYVI